MGITSSVGYGGQVTEAQIPRWVRAIGGVDYTVRGPGSWKVTASGSGARTVQIAASTEGAGKGVSDVSAGGELVELPNPAAGSRWYVVCVHRNTTGTGGTTTLTYVGVASPSTAGATDPWAALALRDTFETTANITDDQPLALVRVTKDNPTIAAGDVIDLRCWQANGGLVGASDYVRGYLDRPGTQIVIDTDLWTYRVTAGGALEWLRTPLASATSHQSGGAAIPGVTVPTSAIAPVQRPITKTGRDRFFTTVAFGNEYAPQVNFAVPFPTACTGVQVLQVHTDGCVSAANVAVDLVSAAGFRVVYPGGSSVTQRAYLWTATGY